MSDRAIAETVRASHSTDVSAKWGARQFYESHGCHSIGQTDGESEEDETDVRCEWRNVR
jgi:hypothetical protein